jgi:hypothetical protein
MGNTIGSGFTVPTTPGTVSGSNDSSGGNSTFSTSNIMDDVFIPAPKPSKNIGQQIMQNTVYQFEVDTQKQANQAKQDQKQQDAEDAQLYGDDYENVNVGGGTGNGTT